MYSVAGLRCITAFGRMPVYSSIRVGWHRNRTGFEVAERRKQKMEKPWEFPRAWREDKTDGQYKEPGITAFICYVDAQDGRIKMQLLPSRSAATLRASLLVLCDPPRGATLWPPFNSRQATTRLAGDRPYQPTRFAFLLERF